MSDDYGYRAAMALDRLIPAVHRDKTVARQFGVSVSTAKHLRGGRRWTVKRFNKAREIFGTLFDTAMTPEAFKEETAAIEERLAVLESKFAQVVRNNDAELLPRQTNDTVGKIRIRHF